MNRQPLFIETPKLSDTTRHFMGERPYEGLLLTKSTFIVVATGVHEIEADSMALWIQDTNERRCWKHEGQANENPEGQNP